MSDYRKHLNKVSLKSKFLNRVEKKSGLVDLYDMCELVFILSVTAKIKLVTKSHRLMKVPTEGLGYLRFPEPRKKAIKDRGLKAFCIVSTMIVTVAILRTNYLHGCQESHHTLPVSELSIEKKPQAEKFNELKYLSPEIWFGKHITCLINEANVRSITEFIIIGKIKHMQL
ncbi:hypothetical protein ALC53_09754 [Atta colombica]|uniref:Uncharacterized protein n=1 Tax=Atta colombica TaxID=520822 RepID=A0A195B6E5_9HYME|nr:hypothetical protein ALC53_09754 [Atta colombica]